MENDLNQNPVELTLTPEQVEKLLAEVDGHAVTTDEGTEEAAPAAADADVTVH